jgi:hypothetical protein
LLQFAKASAATLPQQEQNNTADAQWGGKYIRLYLRSGKLVFAATYLRRVFVVVRRFAAGAQALTHVCTVGACGTKPRREAPPPPRGEIQQDRVIKDFADHAAGGGSGRRGRGSVRHGAKYRSINHHEDFKSFSKISNFRGLGCSRNLGSRHQTPPRSHRMPRFYVRRRSDFL